jgi:hypothetical protein
LSGLGPCRALEEALKAVALAASQQLFPALDFRLDPSFRLPFHSLATSNTTATHLYYHPHTTHRHHTALFAYTTTIDMSRGGGTTLYVTGFGQGTRARDLAYEFERYVTILHCTTAHIAHRSSAIYGQRAHTRSAWCLVCD